jgi:hypothetical protein
LAFGACDDPTADPPTIPDVDVEGKGSRSFTVTNTGEWISAWAAIADDTENNKYTITVQGDVPVPGTTMDYLMGNLSDGFTITLNGNGKLYLNSTGHLIELNNENATLIIDSPDLTLEGMTDNGYTLVNIEQGALELKNGTITGNSGRGRGGGGVYVSFGTFTMTGGTISGNTSSSGSSSYGGGVYVGGTFTMQDGTISGNTSSSYGGGVYVDGIFTMQGGTISGNTSGSGGGVYVDGTFTMQGGTISGNSATTYSSYYSGYGGGVYVNGTNSTFTKTGGTIYGDTDTTNTPPENTAVNGHALFWSIAGQNFFYRNSTLGPGDNISTSSTSTPPWGM